MGEDQVVALFRERLRLRVPLLRHLHGECARREAAHVILGGREVARPQYQLEVLVLADGVEEQRPGPPQKPLPERFEGWEFVSLANCPFTAQILLRKVA